MTDYTVKDEYKNGFAVIQITEGTYKDVEFQFGGVAVEEKDGEAIIKFDYAVTKGDVENAEDFGQFIGKILVNLLEDQLEKNNVVYTGGTDE